MPAKSGKPTTNYFTALEMKTKDVEDLLSLPDDEAKKESSGPTTD